MHDLIIEKVLGHKRITVTSVIFGMLMVIGLANSINKERDLPRSEQHRIRLALQYMAMGDFGPIALAIADVVRDPHIQAGLNPWSEERTMAAKKREEIQNSFRPKTGTEEFVDAEGKVRIWDWDNHRLIDNNTNPGWKIR